MKGRFSALVGFGATIALAAACVVPALADGSLTIKNATVDTPTMVDVRIGTSQADAVEYGTAKVEKGKSFVVDSTNLQVFWRREANPGSGDGKWTDWQRVDVRGGDASVSF